MTSTSGSATARAAGPSMRRSTGSWSPPRPPPRRRALTDQLAPGGRMVIPLGGKEVQQLSVVTRTADGSVIVREVLPVRFTQLETAI